MNKQTPNNPDSKANSWARTIIELILIIMAIGSFVVAWLALQHDITGDEFQATQQALSFQQRFLLETMAVAPNNQLPALGETAIALNNQQATFAPDYPTIAVATSKPTSSSTASMPPTASPTFTLTWTPTPSLTLIPTPVALFSDDFTNGKSDRWEIVYGDPLVVDDALTFTEETLMVLDEKNWINYRVSFDVANLFCQGAVRSSDITLGIHYQDPVNMFALRIFHWDDCLATWFLIKDGEWKLRPNSSSKLPPRGEDGFRHIEIKVIANRYESLMGKSVIANDYLAGGVALIADPNIIIDNFEVTLMP